MISNELEAFRAAHDCQETSWYWDEDKQTYACVACERECVE